MNSPRKDRERKRRAIRGAVIGVAAAVLVLAVWAASAFESLEYRSWDQRARFYAARETPDESVVLVLLDQDSLDWVREEFGLSWPWPRELYAYIVDYFSRAEAASVVFDVLYLDPSGYGVHDDAALEAAIQNNRRFVGSVFLGAETGDSTSWPADLPAGSRYPVLTESNSNAESASDSTSDASFAADFPRFPRASFPIPEVAESARILGNIHLSADSDGVYRRVDLFSVFDGRAVPALGTAGFLVGNDGVEVVPQGLDVPLDRDGRAVLRYRGEGGMPQAYSAAAILQSEVNLRGDMAPPVDPELFSGARVFFGFSAPGLFDLRPTPLGGSTPGVAVHATILDNLLTGGFMKTPGNLAVVIIVLLFAVAAAVPASVSVKSGMIALWYFLFLPAPMLMGFAAYLPGYWFPVVAPTAGVILALVGAGAASYAVEGKQKRFIKSAFQQYLSPDVIENLLSDPERLRLGGERRVLSIFFSDLQGFTGISEKLSPEELTSLLNEYLSAMTDVIHEEGGTVDKYEGDAIIAFWNAPLEQEDHPVRAVRAALHCQQALAELRPAFATRTGADLYMRIGMNTGAAVVGNMGSRTRFDYTMLGDAVNLAARLEGVNKQFGTYTMISEATAAELTDAFRCRELGRVGVVGRAAPVVVYEPYFAEQYTNALELVETFHRALQLYYQGSFEEAARLFESISAVDPPAARYAERCRALQQEPPQDWAGVWVMTAK
ncbi:MAG: adenylate/guanylate cyclase domain-containing protein [Spirochaeta sp.]|nr:adenylate/guanylate cyclase domain-containing protein [Spirochaeta sp.]